LLHGLFTEIISRYTGDKKLIEDLWLEIETSYTSARRYYHNFDHLEHLVNELTTVKALVSDWDTLLWSVFYHDVVYNTLKQNNEEKSAALAKKRLSSIHYPSSKISLCAAQILATKSHTVSDDQDTNLFTDADLCILGGDGNTYIEYAAKIRKEYFLYPDLVYKPGRKKVLQHFLAMERIFKTDHFYAKYEAQARKNLKQELEDLV
jgi:predicted metal-dependent HD superfamily phosphohydrolase